MYKHLAGLHAWVHTWLHSTQCALLRRQMADGAPFPRPRNVHKPIHSCPLVQLHFTQWN